MERTDLKKSLEQPTSIDAIRINPPSYPRTAEAPLRDLAQNAMPFNTEIRKIIKNSSSPFSVRRLGKRMIDFVAVSLALILLSPVYLAIAIMIKLDSRGPIFFTQRRVGKDGRLFRLYKFRSMVMGAEALKKSLAANNEIDGPAFKMKNDPRVTRVGRFIRKTSIDELPQLWNVLRGDMSLVGPRPALPDEVAQWESWQYQRLSVEQGCTCIWQVSGRSNTNFEEWMRMDLEYVQKWSLVLDFSLIMRTVLVMFTGKGAY